MDSQLFVQKYQLYLPNAAELRKEIETTLQESDKVALRVRINSDQD
jgi:hypothetical protein